jgi:hypothetical protein
MQWLLSFVAFWGVLGYSAQAQRLVSFSAEAVNNTVVLSWEVDAEPQAGTYILERSQDGVAWKAVGRVPAFANRGRGQTYQTMQQINAAYRYFRLHFLPEGQPSGTERNLGIAFVNLDCANVFVRATPDPARHELRLHYTLDADKPLVLRVFDHIGQEVWTQKLPSGEAGVYDVELGWGAFPRGVYLLVLTQEDKNLNLTETRLEY